MQRQMAEDQSQPPGSQQEQQPKPKKKRVRHEYADEDWKRLMDRQDLDELICGIANDPLYSQIPAPYFSEVIGLVFKLARTDIDSLIDQIGRQNIGMASRLLLRARYNIEQASITIPRVGERVSSDASEALAQKIEMWERASDQFNEMVHKYLKIRNLMQKNRGTATVDPKQKVSDAPANNS